MYDNADHRNLISHGGAFLISELPDGLRVIQAGQDPSHHEIVPVDPLSMTFDEYQKLLNQIILNLVKPSEKRD